VETAISVPVVAAVLYGIMAFGEVYGAYLALASMSRDGARLAAIGAPTGDIVQALHDALDPIGLTGAATISVTGGVSPGDPVTVAVTAVMTIPVPVPGLPDPLTLTAHTTMRRE